MQNRTRLITAAALLALGSASAALSAAQCETELDYLAGGADHRFGNYHPYQSFIPSHLFSCGAAIRFSTQESSPESAGGKPADSSALHAMTISLWEGAPWAGGTQVASGSTTASPGGWGIQTAHVFWPDVAVTPGQTYYLRFDGTAGANTDYVERAHRGDNPYPDGRTYLSGGGTGVTGYDLEFRHYGSQLPCAADLTGDLTVDINDVFALLGVWGACPDPCPPTCDGDLTDDCTVDINDVFALLGAWGPCE